MKLSLMEPIVSLAMLLRGHQTLANTDVTYHYYQHGEWNQDCKQLQLVNSCPAKANTKQIPVHCKTELDEGSYTSQVELIHTGPHTGELCTVQMHIPAPHKIATQQLSNLRKQFSDYKFTKLGTRSFKKQKEQIIRHFSSSVFKHEEQHIEQWCPYQAIPSQGLRLIAAVIHPTINTKNTTEYITTLTRALIAAANDRCISKEDVNILKEIYKKQFQDYKAIATIVKKGIFKSTETKHPLPAILYVPEIPDSGNTRKIKAHLEECYEEGVEFNLDISPLLKSIIHEGIDEIKADFFNASTVKMLASHKEEGALYLLDAMLNSTQMNNLFRKEFSFFAAKYPKFNKKTITSNSADLAAIIKNAIHLKEMEAVLAQLHAFHTTDNKSKHLRAIKLPPSVSREFDFSETDKELAAVFHAHLTKNPVFSTAFSSLFNNKNRDIMGTDELVVRKCPA